MPLFCKFKRGHGPGALPSYATANRVQTEIYQSKTVLSTFVTVHMVDYKQKKSYTYNPKSSLIGSFGRRIIVHTVFWLNISFPSVTFTLYFHCFAYYARLHRSWILRVYHLINFMFRMSGFYRYKGLV